MGPAPLAAWLLRSWRWKRASLVDQETNLLNPRKAHITENFGNPTVLRSEISSDVDFSLRALGYALPNFCGQLIWPNSVAAEEDLVVTSYGDGHGVFPVRVSHGDGVPDPRQIDGTMTRRRRLHERAQQEQCGKDHGHLNKGNPIDPIDQWVLSALRAHNPTPA